MRVDRGLVVAVAFAAAACAAAGPRWQPAEIVARPTPEPTVEPEGKAALPVFFEPEPLAPPPPAAPFAATLTGVEVVPSGNGEILGVNSAPVDQPAVDAVVGACLARLAAYLDAQFVAPDTRFTEGPLAVLLSGHAQAAVDDAARAALGAVDPGGVVGTATGSLQASARVVADGAQVSVVTLTYEARLELIGGLDDRRPVTQYGAVAFTDAGGGWEAVAADVSLDLGAPPLELQAAEAGS